MGSQEHGPDYRTHPREHSRGLVSTAAVLQNKTALAERQQGKNLKNDAELRRSAKVGLTPLLADDFSGGGHGRLEIGDFGRRV
jgi:hypothetical protein